MNLIVEKMIEYNGEILQDFNLSNIHLEQLYDEYKQHELIYVRNFNKYFNHYKKIKYTVDTIIAPLINIKTKFFNFYDYLRDNTITCYQSKKQTLKHYLNYANLRLFNLIVLQLNEYNLQIILEKINKGWEMKNSIFQKLSNKLRSSFGNKFENFIKVVHIGRDKVILSLILFKSTFEIFSIFSFIEENLNKIKLFDDLQLFDKFRKFLN